MNGKLVIFGDSISTPFIGEGGYEVPLRALLKPAEICNFAVAASGAAAGTPGNVLEALQKNAHACAGAEAAILWHGTNDWYWGSPLGTLGSFDPASYTGALELAARAIRDEAPDILLVTATPLFRWEAPDQGGAPGPAWQTPNKLGHTLADYEAALWRVARAYGVPVVDARALTGFCRQTLAAYQPDNVHPNRAGCERLARIFADHIGRWLANKNSMEKR